MVFRNLRHTISNDLIKEKIKYLGHTTAIQVVFSFFNRGQKLVCLFS